jgi:hypothetical protein
MTNTNKNKNNQPQIQTKILDFYKKMCILLLASKKLVNLFKRGVLWIIKTF